jgi:hypothetical protein
VAGGTPRRARYAMLNVHFVILGAAIGGVGTVVYLRDTLRGVTQPNRVTWLLWGVAPLLAFGVELQQGVGLRALMTFVVGFFPLTIFVASFVNPKSLWRIRKIDYLCGALSVAGLAVWLLAGHGTVALAAFIAADALASVPTIWKSWHWPETESAAAYLCAAVNAAITLLTVTHATTAVLAFPVWILLAASFETFILATRIGPRLASARHSVTSSDSSTA